MVECMKNYLSKLLFAVCVIPMAAACEADEAANYARVFEALCVTSKLEAKQINAVLDTQQKRKFMKAKDLALATPDADAGAIFLNNGTIYFVAYGARSGTFGGAFCSVGTEGFAHSDLKHMIENYFTTFNFKGDERVGGSKVSIYEGFLPGFPKDIAVGIQSDFGMSVLSLFIVE